MGGILTVPAGGALKLAAAVAGEIRTVIALDLPDHGVCRRGDCGDIPDALSPHADVFFVLGERYRPGTLGARASVRDADHNDFSGQSQLPIPDAWLLVRLAIEWQGAGGQGQCRARDALGQGPAPGRGRKRPHYALTSGARNKLRLGETHPRRARNRRVRWAGRHNLALGQSCRCARQVQCRRGKYGQFFYDWAICWSRV